jgi:hypoxanthine-DNA glycosylase
MTSLVHSFPPLEHANARTLILGTMPGAASLSAREYYAHPRNLFWTILGDLLGFARATPYTDRVARLLAADIAVWDVLKSCDRPGSLDSDIARTSIVANDFERFFASHSCIERVFFNGAGAATLYRRHVLPACAAHATLSYTQLPSTSPANAGVSPAAKRRAWQVVFASSPGVISPAEPTNTTGDVTCRGSSSNGTFRRSVQPIVKRCARPR